MSIADAHAGAEHDPFLFEQRQAPIEDVLLELELRNSVTQESARRRRPFEHRHGMAGTIELVGGGETGRTGSDDGHAACPVRTTGGRG